MAIFSFFYFELDGSGVEASRIDRDSEGGKVLVDRELEVCDRVERGRGRKIRIPMIEVSELAKVSTIRDRFVILSKCLANGLSIDRLAPTHVLSLVPSVPVHSLFD